MLKLLKTVGLLKVRMFHIVILILIWIFGDVHERKDSLTVNNELSVNMTRGQLSWLVFLSTLHKLESFEKLRPYFRKCWKQTELLEDRWGGIFLFSDWCWTVQPTVCGSIPGQAVLICIWKKSEHVRRSKPISSISPWFLLLFLPWVPSLTSFNNGVGH